MIIILNPRQDFVDSSSSEIKDNIWNWAEYWGYQVTDITLQQKNEKLQWALKVSNGSYVVIVFTMKDKADFVFFQTKIALSEQHQDIIRNMTNEQYNSFVLAVTDRLVTLVQDWNFVHQSGDNRKIKSLDLVYFMSHDKADKNNVISMLNKALVDEAHVARALSILLNKGTKPGPVSFQGMSSIYG